MGTLSVLINAILQAALFLVVPLVWWVVTARGRVGFFAWLGWRTPRVQRPGRFAVLLGVTFLVFTVPGVLLAQQAGSVAATHRFHGLGWLGVPALLAYALLQTSFAEESLFRGFLLKRLAVPLGTSGANAVQAVIFGLLHALPVGLVANPVLGLSAGVVTTAIGWVLGYVNERLAGGSIVPGWLVHAAANLTTGSLALAALL